MIYASNRDASWISSISDVVDCYGKLFDKESVEPAVLLAPKERGMLIVIRKMIPIGLEDNLEVCLYVPYGMDVPGLRLRKCVLEVVSALGKNRRESVKACLESISQEEFDMLSDSLCLSVGQSEGKLAFRKVCSVPDHASAKSLDEVLDSLYQDYYSQYEYVFLSIDGQHIANEDQYADLSDLLVSNWRDNLYSMSGIGAEEDAVSKGESADAQAAEEAGASKDEPQEYTSEWLQKNTKIKGWLSFFLFALLLGGVFSAVTSIATFNLDDYAGNLCLGAVDILTGLIMLGVAVYAFYCFVKRKSNAVFWGRTYVILVFLTNLLSLVMGADDDGTGLFGTKQMLRGIVWGIVWFLYLAYSEQVRRIIPKPFRKVSNRDKGLLACLVIVPVVLFSIGYAQISSLADERLTQEAEMMNVTLADDERTDGRVVFTVPDSFECESNEVDADGKSVTAFYLYNDEIGSCTICSDYDTDKSESNFDGYWDNWKDKDAKIYSSDDVGRGTLKINGNDCLYRITKYLVNGADVYWRYYMLFDDETGKVFVASFYDVNMSTHYVNELLNSVRFK